MGNGEDSKNIWLYWICKRRRILSQTGMSGEKSSPNYKEDQDPVYKDSAVEAFFRFNSGDGSRQDIYLNFEMNANGAILAGYGKNKTERTPFEADMLQKLNCKAEVEEEQWNVSLMVPIEILECIYGELYLKEGTSQLQFL